MNKRRIEIAARCAAYRDITKLLLETNLITQPMFDTLEEQIQRIERIPIHDDDEEFELAPNVTVIPAIKFEP